MKYFIPGPDYTPSPCKNCTSKDDCCRFCERWAKWFKNRWRAAQKWAGVKPKKKEEEWTC